MAERSEIFGALHSSGCRREPVDLLSNSEVEGQGRNFAETSMVLGLILFVVWTPPGRVNSFFGLMAAACVVALAITGTLKVSQMGLTRPLEGVGKTLPTGVLLCGLIALIGIPLRSFGPGYILPWSNAWQYAVWSLVQEFILQSILFLRLESVLGSRRAVIATASLFALVHIPSPILAPLA